MNKQLKKAVDEKLSIMLKEKPMDIILAMLVLMGKECVKTNAKTMDLKAESTLDDIRYEVKAKITINKIKTHA